MPNKKIKTVLIVDDERHIRLFLEKIVKKIGLDTIFQAGNGEEAIKLHEECKPDLILMDINMPELSGLEGLRLIREKDPSVYIVMLTAVLSREMIENCAELGADHYISKGAPPEEIQSEISSFIERMESEE